MAAVYHYDSIINTDLEAIVNPVNCVGTMGKGLAARMADRWPHALGPYKDACARGDLRPGKVISIDLWAPRWKPFFWDSNDRWGFASTPDDWRAISVDLLKNGWSEKEIVSARSRPEASGTPIGFGSRTEHKHSPTLNEFFTEHGIYRPRWMICFPTKDHWRQPSREEWIRDGLSALTGLATSLDLKSVAVPALGCGLGGLSWNVVRPMLEGWAKAVPFKVAIYTPTE